MEETTAASLDTGVDLMEASAGSTRKMQFVHERATTKKVPFNPYGSRATLTIRASLSPKKEEALVACLRANANMFAWTPSDMTGVPREVIEHHLDVCPTACPVKQKAR